MSAPRIPPATVEEMGPENARVAREFAERLGVPGLPNVFTTLARSQRLFPSYMDFAYGLMPGGTLPRDVTELLILRTSVNTDCDYEWHHHSRIALRVGVPAADVERVREGWQADGWTPEQATLLRAADELHAEHRIADDTWAELRASYDADRILEICLLVGNYTMLAMFLNTAQVQIEDDPSS